MPTASLPTAEATAPPAQETARRMELHAPFATENIGHPLQDVGTVLLILAVIDGQQFEVRQRGIALRWCQIGPAGILAAIHQQLLSGLTHPPIIEQCSCL